MAVCVCELQLQQLSNTCRGAKVPIFASADPRVWLDGVAGIIGHPPHGGSASPLTVSLATNSSGLFKRSGSGHTTHYNDDTVKKAIGLTCNRVGVHQGSEDCYGAGCEKISSFIANLQRTNRTGPDSLVVTLCLANDLFDGTHFSEGKAIDMPWQDATYDNLFEALATKTAKSMLVLGRGPGASMAQCTQ